MSRLSFLTLVAAIAVGALASGCNIASTVGTGPVTSETRPTAAFTTIAVSYGIGVTVEIGPTASIEVRAQESLLPLIETTVEGGRLVIRATSEISGTTPNVAIVTPALEGISLSGGSQGRVDGLSGDQFGIELAGGAGLAASGTVEHVDLQGSGGSHASLQELSASTIALELSGGAVAELTASNRVVGQVSGGAQATVSGDAHLDVTASGGGDVSHD